MKTISATEFKAKCLALLDEVKGTGEIITITKHGRPVAQLVPPLPAASECPQTDLVGSVEILADVVEPVLPPTSWEAERGEQL